MGPEARKLKDRTAPLRSHLDLQGCSAGAHFLRPGREGPISGLRRDVAWKRSGETSGKSLQLPNVRHSCPDLAGLPQGLQTPPCRGRPCVHVYGEVHGWQVGLGQRLPAVALATCRVCKFVSLHEGPLLGCWRGGG